jgi:hypothetical protein
MKRIIIGKDIEIKWSVTTNGERRPLLGRDLRLVMHHTYLGDMPLPFNISESDAEMIVAHFRGVEHRSTGKYRLTLWENFGKDGQTAVDCCDAFELVATTCEETDHAPGDLDISTVNLGTANLQTGMPGKDGLSAYELFKKYNPDSKLTEEEYAETPVQAAGVALAMVEQLEETDAAVKQAEQLREQAEQGREASERTRATAEQERVAAEQQRTLAEQTRVTNESARQTAEAGRQTAETKREENTAEAIRNSEEATRKAEDEAARVRTLADNPPKIVEVDGMAYWAFYDLETQQYITSEYPARGEKGEPGGGSGVNVVQTTGQSKTDVMSQKAVTDELEKKVNAEEGKGLSSNDYTKEEKQKVSTNSELFFILPEGTQFPYTLTEEDKTKFSKARFLILKSASTGSIFVLSPEGLSDPLNGTWAGVYNSTGIVTVSVSKGVIGVPGIVSLSDDKAVKFTAQSLSDDQKLKARTNIDAEKATIVENLEGAEVTIDVKGGTMYVCGELTSLNIASVENSTKPSIIRFTSGATATQFSYPENFNITGWTKPEENKSYTICILFGAGNMTYDE